ncbi:MAG: sterol desaturase family protein [Xanthomonadales bacterium]|nr:sterol desaturase family protein [Xanthomonadales bacterium]
MDPIVFAIPMFFALMGLEAWWGWRRGRPVYRLNDAIASISLGTYSQLTGLAGKLVVLAIYVACYEHLRWFTLSPEWWWVWIVGLLLYDFCYYWQHRLGHEVALLWAAHVVHHQSEEFNLSTALRQTSSGFLFGWIFYLPMALLGFPPLVFVVVGLIDLLYQYWIHTEQIGRLGWFDRVFASPSNHRVHHAVNDRYLDRNYGGILILWDRLFGSFEDEDPEEPPVYGTRAPLRGFEPVSANLQVYRQLWQQLREAPNWSTRLGYLLRPPGWRPVGSPPSQPFSLARLYKFDPPHPRGLWPWLTALQFLLLTLAATTLLGLASSGLPWTALLLGCGWCLTGLSLLGRWLETRTPSRWLLLTAALFNLLSLLSLPWWPLSGGLQAWLLCLLLLHGLSAGATAWLSRRFDRAPSTLPEG